MFLDDGVSRDSAPDWLPQFSDHPNHPSNEGAGNKYRDVHITQVCFHLPRRDTGGSNL